MNLCSNLGGLLSTVLSCLCKLEDWLVCWIYTVASRVLISTQNPRFSGISLYKESICTKKNDKYLTKDQSFAILTLYYCKWNFDNSVLAQNCSFFCKSRNNCHVRCINLNNILVLTSSNIATLCASGWCDALSYHELREIIMSLLSSMKSRSIVEYSCWREITPSWLQRPIIILVRFFYKTLNV